MKVSRVQTTRESVVTGRWRVDFPGLPQTIVGALDMRQIPPSRSRLWFPLDLGLYTFTPMRVRIRAPGQAWIACGPGTAVIIPAFSHYEIDTTDTPQDGHHRWFTFQNLAGHSLNAFAQNESGLARFLDPEGSLGESFGRMVDIARGDSSSAFWPLQYQGHEILRVLAAARRLSPGLYACNAKEHPEEPSLTARVTAYLQGNLAASLDLATIACAVHVSVSTLSHGYRRQTGESPLQTLRRMRIHQVKSLLLQNLSLAAIAEMTGFYDAHHVSREFKRSEGVPVTRFLKSARAAIATSHI